MTQTLIAYPSNDSTPEGAERKTDTQQPLDLIFRPSYSSERFVVGASNQEAYFWVDQWPRWSSHVICLYGPTGSGKSHLANIWRHKSNAYRLCREDLPSLPAAELAHRAHTFLWDDFGSDGVEEPFFHFFNHLKEQKKTLLLVHRDPPANWPIQLPDLKSRLCALPAIPMHEPDDDLMVGVLRKIFQDFQTYVDDPTLRDIVLHAERSFFGLQHTAKALYEASVQENQNINLFFVRRFWRRNSTEGR